MQSRQWLIAGLLAGMVLGTAATGAQAQQNQKDKYPRPGAIPMIMPPIVPPPRGNNTTGNLPPAGGTTWIIPGGWGGNTIIFDSPGWYPYPYFYNGGVTVVPNGGGYYPAPPSGGYVTGFDPNYPNSVPTMIGPDGAVRVAETTALRSALSDLTRAFERRDVGALERHVGNGLSVAVLDGDRYRYTLNGARVSHGLANLVRQTDTLSLRFTSVQLGKDGLVQAYATHRYRTSGGNRTRTGDARFTLVYLDGAWRVSSVSLPQGIIPPAANQ